MTFYRVRNDATGREYTTGRVAEDETVLDEDATDANGRPLPGKPAAKTTARTAAAKKTTQHDHGHHGRHHNRSEEASNE